MPWRDLDLDLEADLDCLDLVADLDFDAFFDDPFDLGGATTYLREFVEPR